MRRIQVIIGYLTLASIPYIIFWLINFAVEINLAASFASILALAILIFRVTPGNKLTNPFAFHLSLRNPVNLF